MKTFWILLFLQATLVYKKTKGFTLDSEIQLCKAKDPKLNECIKQTGQKLLPLVADGIEEWDVPPIDPMHTKSVSFTETSNGNDILMTYTNLVQTGFSSTIIENVDTDLQHGVMNFKLKYPNFYFGGDYEVKGKLLDFLVLGTGKANITVWNGFSTLGIKYRVNDDYIKINSLILGFSFDNIYLDFSNININGDKELSESASSFINDNAVEIINGFKPQLEEFYGKLTSNFLQKIFDHVPYSVLFASD